MKTSFSTLACPTNSFTDITVMAKDLGFDGIELRGVGLDGQTGEPIIDIYDGRELAFSSSNFNGTAERLKALGLAVSCRKPRLISTWQSDSEASLYVCSATR